MYVSVFLPGRQKRAPWSEKTVPLRGAGRGVGTIFSNHSFHRAESHSCDAVERVKHTSQAFTKCMRAMSLCHMTSHFGSCANLGIMAVPCDLQNDHCGTDRPTEKTLNIATCKAREQLVISFELEEHAAKYRKISGNLNLL